METQQHATDNPSLTRDFTSGTEFKGVTTFDTQGYFVPPSGTTEQRDSKGRGLVVGGNHRRIGINAMIILKYSPSQQLVMHKILVIYLCR